MIARQGKSSENGKNLLCSQPTSNGERGIDFCADSFDFLVRFGVIL